MSWWKIFKRELKQMFVKDTRRAVFLFGASIAYIILFSLLYGTHVVKNVPIIIYDEDQTQFSRSLVQAFDDSEKFHIVSYVTTQEEMEKALHEKEVYAAIHIPLKFAHDTKTGRSSTVLLTANGANIIITNTVSTAAQDIIGAFARNTGAKLTETAGQLPSLSSNKTGPITFSLRVLNNPTQSYLEFFVIGLAMAAFQQGVFLAVGASIQYEFLNCDELKNTHPIAVIIGKLLPYCICGTSAFLLTVVAAINIFNIPCKGDITNLLLLSAAFIFSAVGLSFFLAAISNTELTFTRISIAYTVPAFVLSGYTWPQEAMDALSQTISYTFPLSYFSNTVREIMIAGYSPVLYRNSLILFLIGVVLTGMATVCFFHKLRQQSNMTTNLAS